MPNWATLREGTADKRWLGLLMAGQVTQDCSSQGKEATWESLGFGGPV
jgi:hypothetical protein